MTKLPHYTMPLYPALAVLCARALRFPTPSRRWVRVGLIASGAVGALWLLGPQAALLGWTDARHHLGAPGLLALAGCLGLGCLGLAGMARSIAGMHAGRAVACGVIVAACAEVGLLGVTLPASDSLWVTRSLGRVLAPYLDRAIAAAGYHEDSLVLLTRGRVERIAVEEIPEWIRTHPGGLVVVPAGVLSHTGTVQRVGAVAGVNYSRGRRVSLEVFLVDGGGG